MLADPEPHDGRTRDVTGHEAPSFRERPGTMAHLRR